MTTKRDIERRLDDLEDDEERDAPEPLNISIGESPEDSDVEPLVIPFRMDPAPPADDEGGGSA